MPPWCILEDREIQDGNQTNLQKHNIMHLYEYLDIYLYITSFPIPNMVSEKNISTGLAILELQNRVFENVSHIRTYMYKCVSRLLKSIWHLRSQYAIEELAFSGVCGDILERFRSQLENRLLGITCVLPLM